MISDTKITAELASAARDTVAARNAMEHAAPGDPGYQETVNAYLRATVRHLGLVSIAQNLQYESLAAEVDELREELVSARHH